MQTERLFYDYATDEPLKAAIAEAKPWKDSAGEGLALVLDRTIFYPEGGGQPGDRGTVNGCALADVLEKNGEILHIVRSGEGAALKPGAAELALDAVRRRDLTVQHSAQHLLSGVLLHITGSFTVSMHLGDEASTIDLDCAEISAETLLAAEEAVAAVIEEDRPIITHLCPPEDVGSFPLRKIPPQGEEVIRVIEIQGSDFSPCCGTHLRSTGQIGMMRILGAEKYKGMNRISFIAGRRVLANHRLLHDNAGISSRGLKVPISEIGKGTLALLEKAAMLEKRVKELEEQSANQKAHTLIERAGLAAQERGAVLVECYDSENIDEIVRIGKAAQKLSEAVLVLVSQSDLKFAALCSAKGFDIRPLLADAFARAKGKGGGGPSFFQGQFATAEDLSAFLAGIGGRA
ncbi:MAG: alanyl-tRNA editing protein [Treponema sp.]|jgi:alanyl-tRNA synthetase|nr:alanyl-tRNA editing protein [Treponema sp.]